MIILIHTSKTMRPAPEASDARLTTPPLLERTQALQTALRSLSVQQVQQTMHVSEALAHTTHMLTRSWTAKPAAQRAAIDSFLGDIYSGLQVSDWTEQDHRYAQQHLRILSGLYGILRPRDGIYPYRFEMGYKIPGTFYGSAYAFWGETIAREMPDNEIILNLSAVEYSKVLTKYIDGDRMITPRFLTVSPKTGEPTFVVVHTKIARGAFASWMVRARIASVEQLKGFTDIGYRYAPDLSTPQEPVFVCQTFGGLGLSVRLS